MSSLKLMVFQNEENFYSQLTATKKLYKIDPIFLKTLFAILSVF